MGNRSGVGLALSGGGYRASLFHLGACRRLHELGLLQKVDRLSSVSGGSILAGHLADRLIELGKNGRLDFDDWESNVAEPFRTFVAKDIRTGLFLKYFAWGQLKPTLRANALRDEFQYRLCNLKLGALSQLPVEFRFLATDMKYGTAWHFTPETMFSWRRRSKFPSQDIPVATAVAASACFPPLFGPLKLDLPEGEKAYLTDGGVYDNLGIEPIWKKSKRVLVSDAGKPFEYVVPKSYTNKLLRYTDISIEQVRAQRQRVLIGDLKAAQAEAASKKQPPAFEGTLWRLSSEKENFCKDADQAFLNRYMELDQSWYGYNDDNELSAAEFIRRIRTDLDCFGEAESKILENHGYFMADIAVSRYVIPAEKSTCFSPPHTDYLKDEDVREHLKESHSSLLFWKRWYRSKK